jgi:SAM-dependent methyltransferase
VFAHPFVGGDADFYQIAYEGQGSGSYPVDRWEYGESLAICRSLSGSFDSAACLEIGAGDGAFVRRLVGAGVPPRAITALEYSNFGREAITSKCPGVSVRHGDELNLLPDGWYSHIFLFQVLEHLGDLDSFLARLRQLLKPGGSVLISVPNPRRIEFNELNGLLLDTPPNHVSRFSNGAVESLSARTGFRLLRVADEGFSWGGLLPQYLRYRYLRIAQTPRSIPAKIDIRLSGAARKIAASLFALTVLPEAIARLAANRDLGESRLIVLQRREA